MAFLHNKNEDDIQQDVCWGRLQVKNGGFLLSQQFAT